MSDRPNDYEATRAARQMAAIDTAKTMARISDVRRKRMECDQPQCLEIPPDVIEAVLGALMDAHILADEKGPPLVADKIAEAMAALEDAIEDATATEA